MHFPHKEPPVLAGFDQTLGQQLVVGGDHGGRAHVVLLGALPDRWQARAGRHQPAANALRKPVGQLLGQGLRGGLHQHGQASCVYCEGNQYSAATDLPNCIGCVLIGKITLKPWS
jgi:hypothetical protein